MATNTTYTKTNNYGLNLYGDNDPADLRDGYNDSMHTLDDTLGKHLNRIETLESTDTHDAAVLKALAGDNTVDAATASKAKWDKASTDSEQANSTGNANLAALTALGAETVEKAGALKTKIDKTASDVDTLAPKVTANTNSLAALQADTPQKASDLYTKITKAGAKKRALIIFGDSWTTAQDAALVGTLSSFPEFEYVKSYGVDGATIQMLSAQATSFSGDASIDKSIITDVMVIAGTNNVFYDRACSQSDAQTAAHNIRAAFDGIDGVKFHYFPDNSRTANELRNSRYAGIMQGFEDEGFVVHPEYLWICGKDLGTMYVGDDKYGVQHLTKNGYVQLAKWVRGSLNGADYSHIKGSAKVRVSADPSSNITFADQYLTVIYSGVGMWIYGYINNVTFRSTATDAQKKNPYVKINFNATEISANTLPCAGHSDSARPFLAGPSTDAMTRHEMEGLIKGDGAQKTFSYESRQNANRMTIAFGFRSFVFNEFIPLDWWLGESFPVSQEA